MGDVQGSVFGGIPTGSAGSEAILVRIEIFDKYRVHCLYNDEPTSWIRDEMDSRQ